MWKWFLRLLLLVLVVIAILLLFAEPQPGGLRLKSVGVVWGNGRVGITSTWEASSYSQEEAMTKEEVAMLEKYQVEEPKAAPPAASSKSQPTAAPSVKSQVISLIGLVNISLPVKPSYRSGWWFGRQMDYGPHTGEDLGCKTGQAIYSFADGTVRWVGERIDGGPYSIVIQHGKDDQGYYYYTQYLHNSAALASIGQQVNGGQQIAKCGSLGNSTGPHLHFELRRHTSFSPGITQGWGTGSPINPQSYLGLSKK